MRLEDYIRTIPDFPKSGIMFKDISPLLGNVEAFKKCIDEISKIYTKTNIDKIAAFDARGFIFGSVVAYKLGLPLVMIRKKGKLPGKVIQESYQGEYAPATIEIHQDSIQKGDRVLLVDDVAAVGACMKAGCKLIERLGGKIVGCFTVIEFTSMNPQKLLGKHKLISLIKY